jgi:UDP-N-acetylenolpyruvoylglucosamine reductase
MNFSYRNSILKNNNYVLLNSTFELKKAPKEEDEDDDWDI